MLYLPEMLQPITIESHHAALGYREEGQNDQQHSQGYIKGGNTNIVQLKKSLRWASRDVL
jgi:hypothetical protein